MITAFVNVTIRAEQGISGIGIYIAALGLSGMLFERYVGTPLPITNTRGPFYAVDIPLLDRIPYLGTMFFKQNILVYLAILLIPALTFVLHSTTYGMNVHAVGENPAAADSLGISVTRVRYSAVIFGCTMAGLAGASLLLLDGIFQENLTQGAGFIAVALVYFGGWRPAGVAVGALLYGLTGSVILTLKTLGIIPLSLSDLAATAPAVIVVLALLFLVGRYRQPTALSKPYLRRVMTSSEIYGN